MNINNVINKAKWFIKGRYGVLLFMRCNPITYMHEELAYQVFNNTVNYDIPRECSIITLSKTVDSNKNPIPAFIKLFMMTEVIKPIANEVTLEFGGTILEWCTKIYESGAKRIIIVCGSDRFKEYHDLINKYNGRRSKHGYYNFKKIIIDETVRDINSVSATAMRNSAINEDYNLFYGMAPLNLSDITVQEMYYLTRKGLGLDGTVGLPPKYTRKKKSN